MYSQAYGVLKYWLHFSVLLLVHGNRYLPVLCCHYTNGGRRNYIKCHHNLSYDKECRHQGNWCSIGTLHGNQLTNKNCLPHPGEYYVQALWMAFLWTSWTCCQCRCGCVFIYSWKGDILNIDVKKGKKKDTGLFIKWKVNVIYMCWSQKNLKKGSHKKSGSFFAFTIYT